MPKVVYPTEHVLGTYNMLPSADHPDCFKLEIKPQVQDAKDVNKVGWRLEHERFSMEKKGFVKLGTSEATVTVENGFLIVANHEGEKASLRLPKQLNPDGPIVEVDPNHLFVTLPKL